MVVLLFAFALAGPTLGASGAATPPWYQPSVRGADEAALARALADGAFGDATERAAALRAFSASHPGTTAAGLAELEAGRLLLSAGRVNEAIAALGHPDILRTALADYAGIALAQARQASDDPAGAAATFVAVADARPDGPLACDALIGGGDAWRAGGRFEEAKTTLARAEAPCSERPSDLLAAQARLAGARGDQLATATLLDRLDREYPTSQAARATAQQLEALAGLLQRTPAQRAQRQLERAEALLDADANRDALAALKKVSRGALPRGEMDRWRVALGRALVATRRYGEAETELAKVPAGSAREPEAFVLRARVRAAKRDDPKGYEEVVNRFPGTPAAERALFALASFYQKDAQHDLALPYYQRLATDFPEGRWARVATWYAAWGDYRHGRFEPAASSLERAARRWPATREAPALLYWAGRAFERAGQPQRAATLYAEAARRFKHTYYGMRAADAGQRVPAPASTPLPSDVAEPPALLAPAPGDPLPSLWTRIDQLVLLNRHEQAIGELRRLPASPLAQATIAWVESLRGRLRPAMVALKRAYPWWLAASGDSLPVEAWHLLYPLAFAEEIEAQARAKGLDPALVAALVCQESTFDAQATSPAGALGLMQIMPYTGRQIARERGLRLNPRDLYNPSVNLDFGTFYLAQMLTRYGQRVEVALAAYNAGPHRADAWTAAQPDVSAEEFVENIPFSETRHYVATVLANQAQYRRLYSLAPAAPPTRSAQTP